MNHWLLKSEPFNYSIDDLQRDNNTHWNGVRNYQARNFMRDSMKNGDYVLFYHSNSDPSGIAGIARVCKEGYPDFSQFDPKSEYYDSKATKEKPIWYMVDIEFVEKFSYFIPLEQLKRRKELRDMMVTQRGSRLSVQPVKKEYFEIVRSFNT